MKNAHSPFSSDLAQPSAGMPLETTVLTSQSLDAPISKTSPDALALIGAVSHEMRNPLNGILGMAHLLGESKLDAAQRSYLNAIATSGDVLLALVNDLLDLTALRSGAITPAPEPTHIPDLLNQCVELAAPTAHTKGLGLGSTLDTALGAGNGEPLLLEIDGARVRQVVTNLLSNAIKFTRTGGVRLSARLTNTRDAARLDIEVEDTGHGIPHKEQARIFEPFGRADLARAAGIEGTGLGLPLSRGLAQALGGSLDLVRSAPGKGTVMRFSLPLADQPAMLATLATESLPKPPPKPLANKSVLLVLAPELADTPEAQALCETLELLGASARVVSQADALTGPPRNVDHVLLDARFDHAMLWARLCLPAAGIRPTILLTPDNRAVLSGLQDTGFSGYLIRPVRQSSLQAMLTHRFEGNTQDGFLHDPADAAAARHAANPLNVLLVDDNAINALMAKTALQRAGHNTTVADDGQQALDAVKKDRDTFDAVLLDLSMPVLDGFQTARAMRDIGFSGRIIAYTANTEKNLQSDIRRAGFDALAQKPLKPDALIALVEDAHASDG